MSFRLYKARLKCQLRNKENMFWCFIFPFILATCYYFAFNNLWSSSSFKTIKVAYDNLDETDYLGAVLEQSEMSKGTPLFDVTFCESTEAEKLLDDGKIEAYITGSKDPRLFIKQNGMNETIVKAFLDNYRRISSVIETIMADNPNALKEGLLEDVMKTDSLIKEQTNKNQPNVILILYYSLLAFTSMFAAYRGLDEVLNLQADRSGCGARISVAPVHKLKLFLCNMLAAFTIHAVNLLLLFVYLKCVLKLDFGNKLGLTMLTCLIGSLTGLFLGAALGIYVKKAHDAIVTSFLLVGAFLSGMMFIDLKYIIATKAPVLSYINPISLLTDSFYRLYYYDKLDHFWINITILSVMTVLLGIASYIGIRRKTYASI